MWAGRFRFVVFVCVALITTGCSRAPLNPPRLVMSSDTDMTVQLFMQSTILLANYYGYTDVRYADIRERARRSNVNMIDFVIPEAIRATPALSNFANRYEDNPAELTAALQRIGGYRNLVKYYIRTGLRASQSLCWTYMLEIEEKNDFLEFLQKEIGVAYALSTAVLALAQANATLTTSFMIARTGIDGGIDAFQEYRYLKIDRDAARAVVEAAQNQLAQYFLEQVDKTAENQNRVTGGYTFSDALHAVSTIEYQCTRSGIRNLLSRSINNSPSNLVVDQETGNITFRTAVGAPVNPGDGNRPPAGGGGGTPGGSSNVVVKPPPPPPAGGSGTVVTPAAKTCMPVIDDPARVLVDFLCPVQGLRKSRKDQLVGLNDDLVNALKADTELGSTTMRDKLVKRAKDMAASPEVIIISKKSLDTTIRRKLSTVLNDARSSRGLVPAN